MAKKNKKVTKVTKTAKKVVATKKAVSRPAASGLSGILFRRYESPVAFTMVVSCAAFAIFMMVNMVLQNVDRALYLQDEAIMAIQQSNTVVGTVAGASDSAE